MGGLVGFIFGYVGAALNPIDALRYESSRRRLERSVSGGVCVVVTDVNPSPKRWLPTLVV